LSSSNVTVNNLPKNIQGSSATSCTFQTAVSLHAILRL
jgi:hypothetical protein